MGAKLQREIKMEVGHLFMKYKWEKYESNFIFLIF